MEPSAIARYFAGIGISALVLALLFGAINYTQDTLQQSGVNFTVPESINNAAKTAGSLGGVALILMAIVGIVLVVGSLLYIFRGGGA